MIEQILLAIAVATVCLMIAAVAWRPRTHRRRWSSSTPEQRPGDIRGPR